MNYRRIELASGLAAGALGLMGLFTALFGPVDRPQRIELRSDQGSASGALDLASLHPIAIVVLFVLALLVAGVASGAYLHTRRGRNAGRLLLGVSTALLGVGVIVTGWGVGPSLFLSWLCALIATAAADRVHRYQEAALTSQL